MQAKKIVTKIDANPLLRKSNDENNLMRVAAYCRVSTASEDQLESYKAQVAYYTDAIAKNPKWRFVDIYADEGITGTIATKRPNFQRMLRDCQKGKIDYILTKSVARFARNTVDSIKCVRQLKSQGIGVYFEEQALDSLKMENEMAIGLYSVLAQAESENISANVRWGVQQRMKSGTFKFHFNMLGYKKAENGDLEIIEEEAQIVRKIFEMYLEGNSLYQIKKYLENNHILTRMGKCEWNQRSICNILMNEKYCGDLLMQKTFVENCITKKIKKNRGELPKYLITNNHKAIIDKVTFNKVQTEMARRGSIRKKSDNGITQQGKYSGKFALTELLICGECGSPYKRRTWKKNEKSKKMWRCINRLEHGKELCPYSISVEEEKLKQAIQRGISSVMVEKKQAYELILSNISYSVTGNDSALELYALEKQMQELKMNIDEIMGLAVKSTGGHNTVSR